MFIISIFANLIRFAGCWDFYDATPAGTEMGSEPAGAEAATEGDNAPEEEAVVVEVPDKEDLGVKGEGEEEEGKEFDPECVQDERDID